MPLSLLRAGESSLITRIGGKPEVRQFLEGLGFVVGTPVTVLSEIDGNIICSIKDTRIAISKEMAQKISV
ncbi:MAG: ferrous iron transport protein A [Atopobiaceae bacterium]|nr:ferrous iron transport protein A [Atopobiaceae bacterium]MBQ6411756.1 ferrous iron transport protein A [Atopobiaceae bacterium]MBQ6649916.1 ferrous iron transport protein A [Atopobiaceae bacterium]